MPYRQERRECLWRTRIYETLPVGGAYVERYSFCLVRSLLDPSESLTIQLVLLHESPQTSKVNQGVVNLPASA